MATINGTPGNDSLVGTNDQDTINGLGGDDTLDGRGGIDRMVGGDGDDLYFVNNPNEIIVEQENAGIDEVRSTAIRFTLSAWVNNLTLLDGALNGTGNAIENIITGNGLDNILSGGGNTDTLLGLGGNDSLAGGAGGDSMDGGDGNDTLNGGGGVDTMIGGAGDDLYLVNSPNEVIVEEPDGGIDEVRSSAVRFTLSSGVENLTLIGSATSGTGNALGNVITGNALDNTLSGLAGDDLLVGGEGADLLVGGDGNDTLDAYTGQTSPRGVDVVDTLNGGLGNDTYMYWHGGAVVQDAGGVDTILLNIDGEYVLPTGIENLTIIGSSNDNVGITGNDLDNIIIASNEDDRIFGLGGNDSIDAGINHDNVDGGAGDDTIYGGDEGSINEQDVLTGGAGADHFVLAGPSNSGLIDQITDFVSGTDKLRLDGTFFTDIGASGNFTPGDARFNYGTAAFDASDRIIFNSSTGELFYDPDGTGAQAQVLIANNLPLVSATDLEVVNGTAGGSSTVGTDGNDSLVGTAANDTIDGLAGNDTLQGLGGDDSLVGGEGVDSIIGGGGNDTLIGHDGFRDRTGTTSADTLDGGSGDDVYFVQQGDVIAADPGGVDSVFADTSWTLGAGLENLRISAEADGASGTGNELDNRIDLSGLEHGGTIRGLGGNDVLLGAQHRTLIDGGDGNDTLTGQTSGDDTLLGGSGNDVLISAAGSSFFGNWDTLNGGAGNDTLTGTGFFTFDAAPGAANADVITDFATGDTIRIDASVFTNIGPSGYFDTNDARFFSGPGASAGHDSDDRIVYNSTTGQLYYDADGSGSGAAQLFATLPSGTALDGSRIEVVNGPGRVVNGTAGNDSLVGGTSDDTLNGFGGNDTLDGGPGADTMVGGAGDDLYIVNNAGDVVIEAENAGIDEVRASLSYTLPDWVNNLTLTVDGTGTGNEIENVLRAEVSSPTFLSLFGMGGNDTIIGSSFGGGNYYGGAGDDEIHSNGLMRGDAGNDLLDGGDGDNYLEGGAGSDTMSGGAGNDNFFQGADNDGHDQIDGGAGFDWFVGGANAQSGIVGSLATGSVTGGGAGGAGSASLIGIENLMGTQFADLLIGDGGWNSLVGGAGNDTLNGGVDGVDSLLGGAGADSFIFARDQQTMNYLIGDFVSGEDKIHLDARFMPELGASGQFSANDPRFFVGSAAHDADDRIIYDPVNGSLAYDPDGNGPLGDTRDPIAIFGQQLPHPDVAATDIVVDNGATPTPTPGQSFSGTSGNDTIVGTAGNDTIFGNSGNDWIEGRAGNDQLSGGSGMDSYVFREFGAANADTLANFDGGNWDSLRFDNAAFTALGPDGHFAAGDARFFAGAGATGGHDADDRIVYNTSTGALYYDADGAGGTDAQLVATVQGAPAVAAADVWVI